MKKQLKYHSKIRINFLRARWFCLTFLIFLLVNARGEAPRLTVVGNQTGAPPAMKFSELKAVLMGEKQKWDNGKRILIALMKTSTEVGKTTSSDLYDMTGDELNKYWLSLVFQGKAQAPKFFNTKSELENYVSQNPGAIGVIDQPLENSELKIIAIDGVTQLNLSQ